MNPGASGIGIKMKINAIMGKNIKNYISWLTYDGGPGSGRKKEKFDSGVESLKSKLNSLDMNSLQSELNAIKSGKAITIEGPIGSREDNCSFEYKGTLGNIKVDGLNYYEASSLQKKLFDKVKEAYFEKKDEERRKKLAGKSGNWLIYDMKGEKI